MKNFSYILAFVFGTFLFTPSLIALIDRNVDISIAYSVNEEESSSKNQINFEYTFEEEIASNYDSILYLHTNNEKTDRYLENNYHVFLGISSPPPKLS